MVSTRQGDKLSEHLAGAGWGRTLAVGILAGLVMIVLYATQFLVAGRFLSISSIAVLVAGACLAVGGLVGFLFGIPRSLQEHSAAQSKVGADSLSTKEEVAYGANTNLEQISDWLTKILVGVGLTQLTNLRSALAEAARYIGGGLSVGSEVGVASGERLAAAMLVYFTACGFLFAYLWTRLHLAGALAEADLGAHVARVEEKIDAQAKQAQIDALALAKVARQLHADGNTPEIPEKELIESVKAASASVKAQVFYQAERVRSQTWRDDKALMERTIPMFRALIASDPDGRFHRNYGQLGYALKDRREPEWANAEAALTRAIRIRDEQGEGEWWKLYEFNRAVCRIQQDPNFLAKRSSADEVRARIAEDLQASGKQDLLGHEPVVTWLRLNNVRL